RRRRGLRLRPPHVAVATARSEIDDGTRALADPGGGSDLLSVPAAFVQVEKAETGHVPRGHEKDVRAMIGLVLHESLGEGPASEVVDIARAEVLHADRLCNPLRERLADLP